MWSKVGMGGEHHRYYKHTKFRQNPRGDPKFLVDLAQNDPKRSCDPVQNGQCEKVVKSKRGGQEMAVMV